MNKHLVNIVILLLFTLLVGYSASCSGSTPDDNPDENGTMPPAIGFKDFPGTIILGRPTDSSITANILSAENLFFYIEYGTESQRYDRRTDISSLQKDQPVEITITNLDGDTQYYYMARHRVSGETDFSASAESSFHTQRAQGSTFTFNIQGDSHPEREIQFNPDLYTRTLLNSASDNPDFYFTIGDDFSIDRLETVDADTIAQLYINQRQYLGLTGAPIFLVNGNHEQAAAYLLDGTPNNPAVWAQTARNLYYPQPAPDEFYTGDTQPVKFIGQLRDYYAFTWGDALFVVIDPYWHSPVPVANVFGGGRKTDDKWQVTLGDEQYQWFKNTLETSKAKYKFVFVHQVMGAGRGGIELANYYEWGGRSENGVWEFEKMRPEWDMPIHQLMAENGVTILFHGHDHIFVQQELDGVVYQELPQPADPAYAFDNADAYQSGVKLPNSGYLRVTISPDGVKVEYIRSFLPEDEKDGYKNGMVAYSYTVREE